jgi:hypothetical protein
MPIISTSRSFIRPYGIRSLIDSSDSPSKSITMHDCPPTCPNQWMRGIDRQPWFSIR